MRRDADASERARGSSSAVEVTTAGACSASDRCPSIVALVCSAGGLPALRCIVPQLPDDLDAAIIVLQHFPPTHPTVLRSLVAPESSRRVVPAVNGQRLRAGEVVVVPPGKHALVTREDRMVLIDADGPPLYRPSADLLLTSLAVVAGERTIAVVLSGFGNDGATGCLAVHALGGVVIASDQESSAHFDMPSAAIQRDDAVDDIRPVSDIAGLIAQLVSARTSAGRMTGARWPVSSA